MNILFIGKPGSGKGSITQNLLADGFLQLSTGDLLRKEVETGSVEGKEIEELLKQGKFATDETIFKIVDSFLTENAGKSVIFDGYPRNVKQAKACLENGMVFDKVFLIDVTDDLVKERIVNRRVHTASGRVYNTKTMPPKVEGKDDLTGDVLTHRYDDKLEVLDNRLKNFNDLTFPIVAFLQQKGIEVKTIDGASPMEDQLAQVKSSVFVDKKKKPRSI